MKEFNKSKLYKTGGIAKLNISNFRSVSSGEESQDINLAPLTIVCGENSSGKSTLLNSILFMKQVLEDRSIASKGKDEVDLNGPLIQLGEYKNLVNLKSSDSEIKLEFDIVSKPTESSKKLYKLLFELEPRIWTNPNDEADFRELLITKNLDFTIFQNKTSVQAWENLLETLQNEEYFEREGFNSKLKLPDNVDDETLENYRDHLESIKHNRFSLKYSTEKFKFSKGGLKNKYQETGNIQLFFNAEENSTAENQETWDVNFWKCGYSLKELSTNGDLTSLRSKYPFLLPNNINFEPTNYNNINIDTASVERLSEIKNEGNYEGVYFNGGIPEEVMNAELFFKLISEGVVNVVSSIFSSKEELKRIYEDLALEFYSSDSNYDIWEEPEIGEIQVDEEGYTDTLDNLQEIEKIERLDSEGLIQRILSSISDLFYIDQNEDNVVWSFISQWKNGLNLDNPYIEKFDFDKELQNYLQALAEYDDMLSDLEELDPVVIDLKKVFDDSKKAYKDVFIDFFWDLSLLLQSFDEDSREDQYLDTANNRLKVAVKGDLERIILEEFSAIINEYEVSLEELIDVFDTKLVLAELSADIQSNLYDSLNEINKIINEKAYNFKYKNKNIYRSKDTRPTISEPIWFTKEPISGMDIPEPKEIDEKLELLSTSLLNSLKYIGPLRDLKNYEKKEPFFDNSIPVGLNGERFFNYFHEMRNNKSIYPLPYLITEHNFVENYESNDKPPFEYLTLKEAFGSWLEYFEIAQSFDTYYEVKDNNIYGQIKPLMLDDEIRMDSLGVGFSQLAPIILLCLNASEGDTIILEQPELHLHPSVQQKFGDFLIAMSERIQIIVETHSDHMLNRIRRRVSEKDHLEEEVAIYFAERLEGKTKFRLAELDSNGSYKLSDFPKGFFDQGAEDAFTLLRNAMIDTLDQNE